MIDALDAQLISAWSAEPRIPVLEMARRLGVARGTVQARMDRLVARGILDFAPQVSPAALGYPVQAFTTLEVAQGTRADLIAALGHIAEVLEASTVTGPGDLLLRVVARDNGHLQAVVDRILALPGVARSTTTVTLTTPLPTRVLPLVTAAVAPRSRSSGEQPPDVR